MSNIEPSNRVIVGNLRFSILSSSCIRIETTFDNAFEDRPTQVFSQRVTNYSAFEVHSDDNTGEFSLQTADLLLQCNFKKDSLKDNFVISIKNVVPQITWKFGERQKENLNLLGTACTLDFQRVKGNPKYELGLLSREGFTDIASLTIERNSLVFLPDGWLTPRSGDGGASVAQIGLKPQNEIKRLDFYFFGYGLDYQKCLKDFLENSGPVPLIPKWALGFWWSKWHPYNQQELIELVDSFIDHKMPLSALCIDMDWHLVNIRTEHGYFDGWTGYTWNRELIENPPQLLAELHKRGIKVALNLHPSGGCNYYEEAYSKFAEFLGIDSSTRKLIDFDIANPKFAEGYFKFLHHPHEEIGVNMWWIDWQQEDESSLPSLTPLWWLSHLHYKNLLNKQARPLIFARWGGLGCHKFPCGFSGDTVTEWGHLQMLPYFTATAANVCYNWWSHDIGGFQWGQNDPELYIRWYQYGVFSPLLRLHSTRNQFEEKIPWKYDKGTFSIIKDTYRLHIYSISWKMYSTKSSSFIFPTYHLYPESENAYSCTNQYFFGSELLVSPFLSAMNSMLRMSRTTVWIPPGKWFHFFRGHQYTGNKLYSIYGSIDEIPVFAPAGAIVPLLRSKVPKKATVINLPENSNFDGVEIMEIKVFVGADREFVLFEDGKGDDLEYTKGEFSTTTLRQKWTEILPGDSATNYSETQFTIVKPTRGSVFVPKPRIYIMKFHGIFTQPSLVRFSVRGIPAAVPFVYDYDSGTVQLSPIYSDLLDDIVLHVTQPVESEETAIKRIGQQTTRVLQAAFTNFATFAVIKKSTFNNISEIEGKRWIFSQGYLHDTECFRMHVEVALECGVEFYNTPETSYVVIWNYSEDEQLQFEMQGSIPLYCRERSKIPREQIFSFSREFKSMHHCTFSVFIGNDRPYVTTLHIGKKILPPPEEKKPKKSIFGQLRGIF